MTPVQPPAWKRPLGVPLIGSVLMGAAVAVTSGTVEAPRIMIVGAAVGVFTFLATLLVLNLVFRPLAFDPHTRTARVGGKERSLSSITQLRRSLTRDTPGYLIHRFDTADGDRIRVLVAGSPYPGLGHDQLRALDSFIGLLPGGDIDPQEAARSAVAAAVAGTGSAHLATAEMLRADVSQLLDPGLAVPAPEERESVSDPSLMHEPRPAERTLRQQRADEDEAAQVLEALPRWRWWARVLSMSVIVLACAVFSVAVGYGAIDEYSSDGEMSQEVRDQIVPIMLSSLPLGMVGIVAWLAATDAYLRQRRQAGVEWIWADPARLRHGLPEPFHPPWLANARRTWVTGVFACWLLGPFLGLVGAFMFTEVDISDRYFRQFLALAGISSAAGLGLLLLGWHCFRRYWQLRDEDAQHFAALLGSQSQDERTT